MKTTTFLPIAISLLFVFLFFIFFTRSTPSFQLHVINNSSQPVDQIRLLGDGVVTEAVLFNLPAGRSEWVAAKLGVAGMVKYEVRQGLNRADMLIVDDITKLTSYRRVLTINDGNRYIISDADEVLSQ